MTLIGIKIDYRFNHVDLLFQLEQLCFKTDNNRRVVLSWKLIYN